MPIVFLHGMCLPGVVWTFELLPSKHTRAQHMIL